MKYTVRYPYGRNKPDWNEIQKWCDENVGLNYWSSSGNRINFRRSEDKLAYVIRFDL